MDTSSLLENLRSVVKRGYGLDREDIMAMVDSFDALDRQLSRGGLLPDEWDNAQHQ